MIRVLLADDDMDSHELIDDLIEINFREVKIEHALTRNSFLEKIGSDSQQFNLILFNLDLDGPGEESVVGILKRKFPGLFKRTVFITSGNRPAQETEELTLLTRPFSLDYFGEVVQKACVC